MTSSTTRTCDRCGGTVTSKNPEYRYCQVCFYHGFGHHTDAYADLLQDFEALPSVTGAEIHHTGGGCFGIGVRFADGRFAFMTDTERLDNGELEYDATLENGPEGLSYLSLFVSEDAFQEGDQDDFTGEVYGTGAEIVAWLAAQ